MYFRCFEIGEIQKNVGHLIISMSFIINFIIDGRGRRLLALCKTTNNIIANGRLHSDQEGKYTYCSQRGSSVTDYLLLDKQCISILNYFDVLDWNPCSDHAPLNFRFCKAIKKTCVYKTYRFGL